MARPAIRFCLIVGIAAGVAAFGTLAAFGQGYMPDYRQIVTLHEFGANEPGIPTAGVVFDKAGNLYGTESGGLSGSPAERVNDNETTGLLI